MPDDISRRRWSDDRIDDLANEVRALRQVPGELGKAIVRQEDMRGDVTELKDADHALKNALDALEKRLTAKIESVEERVIKSRRDTLKAVLAFATPVTVAVIGAAVAVITGHAP